MADDKDKDKPANLEEVRREKQEQELAEMRANIDKMLATLPIMTEFYALQAKLKYARYNALREAGFNPEQALEICKDDQ